MFISIFIHIILMEVYASGYKTGVAEFENHQRQSCSIPPDSPPDRDSLACLSRSPNHRNTCLPTYRCIQNILSAWLKRMWPFSRHIPSPSATNAPLPNAVQSAPHIFGQHLFLRLHPPKQEMSFWPFICSKAPVAYGASPNSNI